LLITNGAYTLYATIDSVLIGAILNAGLVGLFTAPMRLVAFLGYVGQAVGGVMAPRVARAEERREIAREWAQALRWLIVFQATLVAVPLVWARQLVTLILGTQFRGGGEVMRVLSLYIFLVGPSALISVTVNYLGAARRRIPVVLLTLAVNALLDALLLPLIGVLGAAIGTTVAYAIYVPAHFRICRASLDFPLAPLARSLLRAALAMGANALVLVVLGTGSLSPVDWVLGLTLGPGAYLAVLLITREVSPRDLRALWQTVSGRLRAGPGKADTSEVAQPGGEPA
jgi:O-antigen/teichoic acid export membrane protein